MCNVTFSELVNIKVLKTMSENLYITSGIPIGIFDVDGTNYVSAGWQDICNKYHRVKSISCERCSKSVGYIKEHLLEGGYVTYKCQNNLWDIAMPIIIAGEHMATVFVGQFFYEEEPVEEEYFRKQARELGFDEEEYITALRKVPRFSKDKIKSMIEYYAGLITTLAESGYRLLEYKRSQEELERSKQYFKKILNAVNDAIVIFDMNGKVIDANETAIRKTGFSREELLNKNRLDLTSKNSPNSMMSPESIVEILEKNNPLIYEEIAIDKQGNEEWIEINLYLTMIDGEKRIVSAARDIGERKQAELALLNQTQELEKLRTEFFANISHELRTPLNIIFSSNQMIGKYLQDNDEQIDRNKIISCINMGNQNCFRLLRLINNLIDVTKLDSGLFELSLTNCNIINIVEDITLSTAEYIKSNDLTLTFDTDVEEKMIACDPDKVERIVLNLLSNCVKFTNKGGSIFVNVIDGGEFITITVEDNGIGIPKEKLDVIFERFRQVDKSFTRNQEGSGIGLSLVKSLIEMHGGNIFVESEYGKGTKFIIKLPVHTLSIQNNDKQTQHKNNNLNNYVERINIEFSDIYK